jgi:hypothetical protein
LRGIETFPLLAAGGAHRRHGQALSAEKGDDHGNDSAARQSPDRDEARRPGRPADCLGEELGVE